MIIICDQKIMLRKILVSVEELTDINSERLKKALIYVKNNLIDSDNNTCLTADSFINISNIITGSNNITRRKVNVKPYRRDKTYMNKDLILDNCIN